MSVSEANRIYQELGPRELIKRGLFYGYSKSISKPWKYIDPLDKQLSVRTYGNKAGFTKNVGGALAERKSSMRSRGVATYTVHRSLIENASRFRSEGYVDLGTPYNESTLSRVNDRYNELLESGEHTRVRHTNDPMKGETYILGIDDVGKHLPEVSALLTDDIIKTLQAYYNAHIQIRTIRAYRTYHVPDDVMRETEIYNNNWHFDGKSTDHTKLFVCLDDTSEDDGPLHIMPKDDTREIVTRRPGFDRDVDGLPNGFVDEIGSAVKLTGPAGTAMLGTTQSCLHRAGVPSEGHQRDLVQFYIAPSSKPLPDDWIDRELGGTRNHVVERLLEY